MPAPPSPRWRTVLPVVVAVIVLDQITKELALSHLQVGQPVHVIWTLQLNLTSNDGAAFSMGSGSGSLIAVAALVVLVVLVRFAGSIRSRGTLLAMGAMIGGALSNLGDRAFRGDAGVLSGGVIDFVDVQWWPVFNVADAAIVCGGIGLVLLGTREPRTDA